MSKQHKERLQSFMCEFGETLENLKIAGWDGFSDDPDVQELQMSLFEMDRENVKTMARAGALATHARDGFVKDRADWEKGISLEDSSAARAEILGMCLRRGAQMDFIDDLKRRWTRAEFSSIGEFLVIGDVYARTPKGCQLRKKDEADIESLISESGRKDLTYAVWQDSSFSVQFPSSRLKINGERFVVIRERTRSFMRGFKELELVRHPNIELVEYYAGQWYVLSPLLGAPCECPVIENGEKKTIQFLPHPFLSPREMMKLRPSSYCHKYDGVMMWNGKEEIRVKWQPSTEVEIDNVVWEVTLGERGLHPIRPRPGKKVMQSTTAISFLRSRIRAEFVLKYMNDPGQVVVDSSLVPQEGTNIRLGAKALGFTRDGYIVLIREKNKRLDEIGGQLNFGEAPMEGLIREVKEETGVVMHEKSFFYLGVSQEVADSVVWQSHAFVFLAPEEMLFHPLIERYKVGNFMYWLKSDEGRPRAVWMARHFDLLSQWFRSTYELNAFHALMDELSPPCFVQPDVTFTERARETLCEVLLGRGRDLKFMAKDTQEKKKSELYFKERGVHLDMLQFLGGQRQASELPRSAQDSRQLLERVFRNDQVIPREVFQTRFLEIQYNAHKTITRWLRDCEKVGLIKFLAGTGHGELVEFIPKGLG